VKAEILYYRGLSYRALGQLDRAASWLREALTFAEEHDYNRLIFRAEQALDSLGSSHAADEPERASPAAPAEVREGLRAMRQELVTLGG
jgi:tetratricopeptide (TPR) repeat protein